MVKTLLFGAGTGSKIFIENEKSSREFLAFIDNDISRHNTMYNSLDIISPLDIKNYEYDEIVITTQWAKEVKRQLIEDLKIDENKVLIPLKSLLKKQKPFEDENTKKFARRIIQIISTNTIKNNINLFVDFGTLLGLVRDGDIISWDDDIDFAICTTMNKEFENLIYDSLLEIDKDLKWNIYKQKDKESQIVSLQIKFEDTKKYKSFITSVTLRENRDGYSFHLASLGQWFAPSLHFDTYEKYIWRGIVVLVPKEYKKYLEFVYGNWNKPKKNMTIEDYNNINEVSFDKFRKADLQMQKV